MRPSSRLWSGDPRVKPPFGAAEIHWTHPLSLDLMSLILGHGPIGGVDIVRGVSGSSLGGTNQSRLAATPMGEAYHFNPTTFTGAHFLNHPAIGTAGLSVCARASTLAADSAYRRIMSKGNLLLLQNAANHWAFSVVLSATEYDNASRAIVVGEEVTLVGTNNGTNTKLYTNGVLGENVSPFSYSAGVATLVIGQSGATSQTFNGYVGFVSIYSRPLDQQSALWLHAEPYAMLSPIVRRRYFVPAAAGGIPTLVGRRFSLAGPRGLAG